MAPLLLSSFLALPVLVHDAAALHVGAPSRTGGRGPEWVDETIRSARGSEWASCTRRCQGTSAAARPHVTQPEVKPAPVQGPLTEFSDLSPAEMAWVDQQYSMQRDHGFVFVAPNATDPAAPPGGGGGDAQELPLTTGECKPAHNGYVPGMKELQTCRLRNVYAVEGALVAHVLASDTLPSAMKTLCTHAGRDEEPAAKQMSFVRHASKGAFQAYMRNATYTRLDGTTLAFEPKWHFNIGHALYDGLYPAFVSLVQWGMGQDPFRVLKLGPPNNGNVENKVPGAFGRNEEVYGLIGGKGIVSQHVLREDRSHLLFETLVIGMGRNSQKLDVSSNFSNGGGRGLGAARLLRSRAFKSLDIPAREQQPRLLEGIIINNKRLRGLGWIEPLKRKAAAAGVKLEFTDWAKAPDQVYTNGGSKQNPCPTSSQFRDQLLLISRTYIHISNPGTGMMYQQFLPDGAVHINLGEAHGHPRLFMEENMAEGAPYIRALYYWPKASGSEYYDADRIMELVEQAKVLIEEGFEIPVPVNTNLSPTLRVVKAFAYLTQDEDKLRLQTPLRLMGPSPSSPSYDMHFFGNHYPHEFLQDEYFKAQVTRHILDSQGYHLLSPCLLRELTHDYGKPCDGCEWGFP